MIFVTEQDIRYAFGDFSINQCLADTETNFEVLIENVNKEITFLIGDLAGYTTEEKEFIVAGLKNASCDLARYVLFSANLTEDIKFRGIGARRYFNDIKSGKIQLLQVRTDASAETDENTVTSGNMTFGNLRKKRVTDFINTGIEIW